MEKVFESLSKLGLGPSGASNKSNNRGIVLSSNSSIKIYGSNTCSKFNPERFNVTRRSPTKVKNKGAGDEDRPLRIESSDKFRFSKWLRNEPSIFDINLQDLNDLIRPTMRKDSKVSLTEGRLILPSLTDRKGRPDLEASLNAKKVMKSIESLRKNSENFKDALKRVAKATYNDLMSNKMLLLQKRHALAIDYADYERRRPAFHNKPTQEELDDELLVKTTNLFGNFQKPVFNLNLNDVLEDDELTDENDEFEVLPAPRAEKWRDTIKQRNDALKKELLEKVKNDENQNGTTPEIQEVQSFRFLRAFQKNDILFRKAMDAMNRQVLTLNERVNNSLRQDRIKRYREPHSKILPVEVIQMPEKKGKAQLAFIRKATRKLPK